MENKKATIHTIAAHLNMSASTVSRALNDNKRISQKTRDLVKKTAREMNYKPNQLASNLRKGKANLIGVIIPRINRHFFSHAIAGMESVTNPAGYNLMICQTNEALDSEKRSLQTMIKNRVDGIIISVSSETVDGEHIQSTLDENVPVVFFDRPLPKVNTDHVINDNHFGTYESTKHLINQGYKKIVHFTGPLHNHIYAERLKGYRQAMSEAGLEVDENDVYENVITRDTGREVALKMIKENTIPDAICSASDYSALGALLVFKEVGIKVPEEVGITGFANEPFTELMEPGITTLEQFGELIGESAAKMMISRIENKNEDKPLNEMSFKPKLIIRQSSLKK